MGSTTSAAPADLLFVQNQRWGWEYVDPEPLVPSPEADEEPAWEEPPAPDVSALKKKIKASAWDLPVGLAFSFLAFLVLSEISDELAAVAFALGLVVTIGLHPLLPITQIIWIVTRAKNERTRSHARFIQTKQRWKARVAAHDKAEQARQAAALLWDPLRLRSEPSRVDVVGGTPESWANLLVTVGCSLALPGTRLVVIDFSQQYVAGALADLLLERQRAVTRIDLPADGALCGALAGLAPDEVAEVLARAVQTLREPGRRAEQFSLTTDLLQTVLEHLTTTPTFHKIVAGLKVLNRTYDSRSDKTLDSDEVSALTSAVDTIGQSDTVRQELRFLASVVGTVAKGETSSPDAVPLGDLWHREGLTLVATKHNRSRPNDFLDRVVFHRLLHDVHDLRGNGEDVLFVIAPDEIGLRDLEALADECRKNGLRLVLLLRGLRDDLSKLLGRSDSATIVMRLGNDQEAEAAARYIGRGHRFVLSEISTGIGTAVSRGKATSTGFTTTTSKSAEVVTTRSSTSPRPGWQWLPHSHSRSTAESAGTSDSTAHSTSTEISTSSTDSENHGTTRARVYEFIVEPTTIQSLPSTAFLLVENLPSERRVVMGDCNPGIVLEERVAPSPRV